MFEYDKDLYEAAKKLDEIDLTEDIKYLKEHGIVEPEDIMYNLSNFYMNDSFDENLYEFGIEEFMDYLSDRYGVCWGETTTYFMRSISK